MRCEEVAFEAIAGQTHLIQPVLCASNPHPARMENMAFQAMIDVR